MNKKRKTSAFLALVLVLSLFPTFAFDANAAEINNERIEERDYEISLLSECEYENGSAIVTFAASENAALAKVGTCAFDSHITVADVHDFDGEYVAYLTSDKYSTEQLIKKAYDIYYVTNATANKIFKLDSVNDAGTDVQWYLSGINIDSVPEVSSLDDVVVAVIDTGIDYTHEDLKNSLWVNPVKDSLPGTYGYDTGDSDDDPWDTNGHGTHVSGIIAAESGNDIGISGISTAKIMSVKATSGAEEYMYQESIVDAFEYIYNAINLGVNVKVVNCSWGGEFESGEAISNLVTRIGEAGAVCVFAAGNDGADDDLKADKYIPFDLDSNYTIVVGSSGASDTRSSFSNYGKTNVDIFAPGENIYSTYKKVYEGKDFEPLTLSKEDREDSCIYLTTLAKSDSNVLSTGEDTLVPLTAEEIGMPSDYVVKKSLATEGGNTYLTLSVTLSPENYNPGASDGREHIGSVYLDVTDLNLDESQTYYVSWHESGLSTGNYWTTTTLTSDISNSRFTHYNGRTYFRICGLSLNAFGTFTVNLDNLTISKANIDVPNYSYYEYQSGTSMAAPVVSGAVALVAQIAPDLSATELKAVVLNSVREVDALSNYCVTGGVLDLSKLPVYAKSLTLNKSKKTVNLKYGKTLSLKAKLKPSNTLNTAVTWTVSNSKYAKVTKNGVVKAKKAGIGHKVKIVATAANGKKDYCIVKIKG